MVLNLLNHGQSGSGGRDAVPTKQKQECKALREHKREVNELNDVKTHWLRAGLPTLNSLKNLNPRNYIRSQLYTSDRYKKIFSQSYPQNLMKIGSQKPELFNFEIWVGSTNLFCSPKIFKYLHVLPIMQ